MSHYTSYSTIVIVETFRTMLYVDNTSLKSRERSAAINVLTYLF
jgi:hypothetical protein